MKGRALLPGNSHEMPPISVGMRCFAPGRAPAQPGGCTTPEILSQIGAFFKILRLKISQQAGQGCESLQDP